MTTGFKPFVYGLVDPQDRGHVRYVGMASKNADRPKKHGSLARNPNTKASHLINWVRSLQAQGRDYEVITLEELSEGTLASFVGQVETMYITSLSSIGHRLTNMCEGGYGGETRSSDELAKLTETMKGNTFAVGRKHSTETKERMRQSRLKWNAEHPLEASALAAKTVARNKLSMPDDVRQKISATKKGAAQTEKMLTSWAAKKGSKMSLEARQKMSDAHKKNDSDESRAAMGALKKNHYSNLKANGTYELKMAERAAKCRATHAKKRVETIARLEQELILLKREDEFSQMH